MQFVPFHFGFKSCSCPPFLGLKRSRVVVYFVSTLHSTA